jgi:putative membrane protein
MLYLWVKSLHIVFVIAWMAAVFYLPRILVNVVEAGDAPPVRERLVLMAKRLYRFGHIMFALALVFGLTLWLHFGITGAWLHIKLALVGGLLGYYIWSGRLMKRAANEPGSLPSSRMLRLSNELPVFVLLAVVYLVVAKPL